MLEIHVANTELTDSVVQVSWCVDKESADWLKDHNNVNMVFIVCPELPEDYKDSRDKESRTIVPFKDGMAYLELKYPGKNYIYAFVSTRHKSDIKSYIYYNSRAHRYHEWLLDDNGRDFITGLQPSNWFYQLEYNEGKKLKDCIEINVPDGVFAPEPPEWEKEWVNYFWRDKPVDQCNYRRRRILAYTLQPFFFLLRTLVVFVVTTIAFSIGSKAFSLKYLLHPLTYEFKDIIDLFGPSIFVRDVKAKSDSAIDQIIYAIKKYGLFVFSPIMYIYYIGLILKVKAVVFVTYAIGLILFGLIPTILFLVFILNLNSVKKFGISILEWVAKKLSYYDDYEDLVCNGQPFPTKVNDLSPKRRSFRLKFAELKSKVCKPFKG